MSVSDVMTTMMSQDATYSMGAESIGTGGSQPSGSDGNKPMVKSVEDVMSLYDDYGDDSAAANNGVTLKEDKNLIPDELNNVTPKDTVNDEKVINDAVAETSKDVISESSKLPDMVKVKVNGTETEVPLQDVVNSYSGQQEIQRRFTEFDKTKKAFESEKKELVGMNDYVKQEIGDLRSSFSAVVSQYEKNGYMDKNPLDAVNQLLDKMGINSNLFQRAVFEHQLPDYAKFFNMSDVERDAHYTKQENDYLRKKEQGFTERDQQVKLREEGQRKDLELIKDAGLDSVKYDEFLGELREAGHENITAEKVVEYAKQKPTLDKVIDVFNKLGQNPIGHEKTQVVFNILKEFPDTTADEILDHMDPNRVAMRAARVLDAKTPKISRVSSAKDEDQDLDDMLSFYKN
jgi:hypothetical protein